MTILVKNEADIIEKNIKVHKALGVDAFVVMDNDSTDGTREILEKLQKDIEIIIIEEKGLYSQKKWMTGLADIAKRRLDADWVISNDADEFWIPTGNKNINEVLKFKGDILICRRYNMILSEGLDNCFDSVDRVENPIHYDRSKLLQKEHVSIALTKNSPKVIVNPHGLFRIAGGNHSAVHIKNLNGMLRGSGFYKEPKFEAINVYHYPFRSYEQFERNIKNRKMLLESGRDIKMGPHYKRLIKLYNLGVLEEEFKQYMLFRKNDIEVLKKYEIICEDKYPKERICNLLARNENNG
jgi:glycosyltransferase involved in cell wall biosynthesis